MNKLYVLYDPQCELCCRLKQWILVQRSWIGLAVVEQGSEKARRLFPELEHIAGKDDLAVVSEEGDVYLNNNAWIMVLYAMVEYREWASRLTHPLLCRSPARLSPRYRKTVTSFLPCSARTMRQPSLESSPRWNSSLARCLATMLQYRPFAITFNDIHNAQEPDHPARGGYPPQDLPSRHGTVP